MLRQYLAHLRSPAATFSVTTAWRTAWKLNPHRRNHSAYGKLRPDFPVALSDHSLHIKWNGSKQVALPYTWLRDSCPCPECIHPSTRQKLHRTSDVPTNVKPLRVQWVFKDGARNLAVEWDRSIFRHDTGSVGLMGHSVPANIPPHQSFYPDLFLQLHISSEEQNKFHHASSLQMIPWEKPDLQRQESLFLPYEHVKSSKDGFRQALTQLAQFGLLILTDVPNRIPREGDDWELRKVANLFSHVRETFYGQLWDVKSLPKNASKNIAYTDLDLDLHMDLL
jgi:gamma-butyrobetaine dioxygenase